MKDAVIIMSRVPKPGKTKTRLMPRLSSEEACRVHTFILSKVSKLVRTLPSKHYLYYTGGTAKEFGDIVSDDFVFKPQQGNDLGARMDSAFKQVFAQKMAKVVMVGSDIPLLTEEHFTQAIGKLEQADLVLGPNNDGGYYLIGMKQCWSELFLQKKWGTESVLTRTLKTAEELGLKVELLAYESDIDTYQDIIELVNYLAQNEERKRDWQDMHEFFAALINHTSILRHK